MRADSRIRAQIARLQAGNAGDQAPTVPWPYVPSAVSRAHVAVCQCRSLNRCPRIQSHTVTVTPRPRGAALNLGSSCASKRRQRCLQFWLCPLLLHRAGVLCRDSLANAVDFFHSVLTRCLQHIKMLLRSLIQAMCSVSPRHSPIGDIGSRCLALRCNSSTPHRNPLYPRA